MASLEELRKARIEKLEILRSRGINPYPSNVTRSHTAGEVHQGFDELTSEGKVVYVAGRVRALRVHGGSTFLDLEDGTGKIQVFCEEATLGKELYNVVCELTDSGDFVEVSGTLFKTKKEERTVAASTFRIIAKTLRPVPEEYFGLKDIEERLRRRYLDLVVNKESRELFIQKARFWQSVRSFFEEHGFIEVDTPALEDVPGGADTTPFITHYNALDKDFYLRISLELPLKKIIVGGFEKIYEIGKVFRNEGISAEHLQDFLHCEFYWAYADYNDLAGLVENMFRTVVEKTTGDFVTTHDGKEINWAGEWKRMDFFDAIKNTLGNDLSKMTKEELVTYGKSIGLTFEPSWGTGRMLDYIWKKKVRPHIIQPTLILHHPIEVSPLAKSTSSDPLRVERVQVIAAGTELGNGWSELNDPLEQRARFEEQQKLRERGDTEAQMKDESYLEALEYGMPPTAGFGFSERLFAVLMNKPIRETVIFPPMREQHD